MGMNNKKWELNWQNTKLYLQHVKSYNRRNKGLDQGYGVFAKSPIKKRETLTIFGGYIIPINKVKNIPKKLQEYCYQIHDDFLFGPVEEGEVSLSEHFNHSCNPNTGFKDSITLISTKNIKKGEEVTIDYAMCITTRKFDFKCSCNSKNCRLLIAGDDWKIKGLQKKYKNYFQPYILEKIKRLNKK